MRRDAALSDRALLQPEEWIAPRSRGSSRVQSGSALVDGFSAACLVAARYGLRPSSNTTSLSPSPTAAKMKRPSDDHETRRTMKVGC